ncbi:MAG TPA: hypothetical protein VGN18_12850 [Jatrophihabitans sp.]|uniref:hypothetical protein n=1 Tax=Jatrophihabitans sp. TaxID=1932789 RepID=UPI002DF847CC|nr:hypothetical protein [Jatrophihabitans sp.]
MTSSESVLRRRIGGPAAALAAGLAGVAIATSARWGPDWPAQEFRAWSAAHNGLTAWTNQWYSGQALPGYSVIYPVVGGVLGAALTGLLAAVVAALGAFRLAPAGSPRRRAGYHASVCLVLGADLLIGQVPYLLGVAAGVWAIALVRSDRRLAAACLAGLSSLGSPLAGAFVLLAIPVVAAGWGRRRAYPLAAALAGITVSSLLGGGGGPFPYTFLGLLWTLLFAGLCIVVPSRSMRALRRFGLVYAAVAIVVFLVPNPLGGNLVRLGQLVALPLIWHTWPQVRGRLRRPVVAVALVVLAAVWSSWPALTSVGRGAGDPSQARPYYRGLLTYLRGQNPTTGRLEVVFTREHWEAMYVASAFPIARGWERQTDMSVNAVLYRPLTATGYRQWLDDNAVSMVALPTAPIDFGGRAEQALLRDPPTYLRPAWHDANWQVWRVRSPSPMVTGPATLRNLGAASFELDFTRAGTATVRIRTNSMWSVTRGRGCVLAGPGHWLRIETSHPGRLLVSARVGLAALDTDTRCS